MSKYVFFPDKSHRCDILKHLDQGCSTLVRGSDLVPPEKGRTRNPVASFSKTHRRAYIYIYLIYIYNSLLNKNLMFSRPLICVLSWWWVPNQTSLEPLSFCFKSKTFGSSQVGARAPLSVELQELLELQELQKIRRVFAEQTERFRSGMFWVKQ